MAITWPAKNNYATGDVLTATNMNGIGDDLNALFDNSKYAGKNKIINGDFGIWQRGTSFSNPSSGAYFADRWTAFFNGTSVTRTVSQQAFTAGTAPVAGYEGQYFLRFNISAAGSGNTYNNFNQQIEDVRTFAGQTATISFWAKADTTRTITGGFNQSFGSGGSATVTTSFATNFNLTTSWQRFSATVSVPSVSGKTIGASSYLGFELQLPSNTTFTVDIWGVQVEAGSTATPFQTATGTIQGELAACQRYYNRLVIGTAYGWFPGIVSQKTTTAFNLTYDLPVQMRVAPTSIEYGGSFRLNAPDDTGISVTSFTWLSVTTTRTGTASGVSSTATANTFYRLQANNDAAAYIGWSAEL